MYFIQLKKETESDKIIELYIFTLRAKRGKLDEIIQAFEETLNDSVADKFKEFRRTISLAEAGMSADTPINQGVAMNR